MAPIKKDTATAIKNPVMFAFNDFLNKTLSPRVVASDRATFGPIKGAITIAPIITATLFLRIAVEATMDDKITKNIKN